MGLTERLVQLARDLGATSVHLVYIAKSGRWCIVAMIGEGGLVRFFPRATPEQAIEAASKGASSGCYTEATGG